MMDSIKKFLNVCPLETCGCVENSHILFETVEVMWICFVASLWFAVQQTNIITSTLMSKTSVRTKTISFK